MYVSPAKRASEVSRKRLHIHQFVVRTQAPRTATLYCHTTGNIIIVQCNGHVILSPYRATRGGESCEARRAKLFSASNKLAV